LRYPFRALPEPGQMFEAPPIWNATEPDSVVLARWSMPCPIISILKKLEAGAKATELARKYGMGDVTITTGRRATVGGGLASTLAQGTQE
jgi:hypothetical protein